MSHSRQMHFGVFWVGTGNHLAGWRHEGAATSNSNWPAVVEQEISLSLRPPFDKMAPK